MDDVVASTLARPRIVTTLLLAFAILALALAAVGVYGVMAYSVSQRTRELGIRLALGATTGEVRGMVFRQGLTLTIVGIALGVVAAMLLSNLVSNLLFGVSAMDPVTFSVIPLILIAVAGLAIYIPARRASRVDPVVALRIT
jgi:putative ABC transport system permease protein